jgi:alkaline phosphatase
MAYTYLRFQVIFGGGERNFRRTSAGGKREEEDLVDAFLEEKKSDGSSAKFLTNTGDLESWVEEPTEFVLGLFAGSHMPYELDRSDICNDAPLVSSFKTQISLRSRLPVYDSVYKFFMIRESSAYTYDTIPCTNPHALLN